MLKRLLIFSKAQASAFTGGVCDYCIMLFFTEIVGIHYRLSIVIGCILGAIINFSLNRRWSFYSKERRYQFSGWQQLARFAFVAGSSIMLKVVGTSLFTSFAGIDYKISRLMTDILVSLLYNYILQYFWVFKKEYRTAESLNYTALLLIKTKNKSVRNVSGTRLCLPVSTLWQTFKKQKPAHPKYGRRNVILRRQMRRANVCRTRLDKMLQLRRHFLVKRLTNIPDSRHPKVQNN
ncbi:MAG: GtrA family protein [Prevotellaceae bacterium]|jgi:putative flippase GtrA|nr:GtrA family protein [Prevotellaceae bacterium]